MADIDGSYFAFIKQSLTWHLLRAKHCFTNSFNPHSIPMRQVLILQMKHRKGKQFEQGHTAGNYKKIVQKKKNRTVGLISRCYNLSCKCR